MDILNYIDSIGMNNLTNDAIMEIMLRLDDQSLAATCNTNLKISNICNSELFWRRKLEQLTGTIIPTITGTSSWKTVYEQSVPLLEAPEDYCYLLATGDRAIFPATTSVYSDSTLAYNELLRIIPSDLGFSLDALLAVDLNTLVLPKTYTIFIVPKNVVANIINDITVIFSIGGRSNMSKGRKKLAQELLNQKFINSKINYYPRLVSNSNLIGFMSGGTHEVFIDDITNNNLALLGRGLNNTFGAGYGITVFKVNTSTAVKFRAFAGGNVIIERWVLPQPLMFYNDGNGFVLYVLGSQHILLSAADERSVDRGRYLQRDIQNLLAGAIAMPNLTDIDQFI